MCVFPTEDQTVCSLFWLVGKMAADEIAVWRNSKSERKVLSPFSVSTKQQSHLIFHGFVKKPKTFRVSSRVEPRRNVRLKWQAAVHCDAIILILERYGNGAWSGPVSWMHECYTEDSEQYFSVLKNYWRWTEFLYIGTEGIFSSFSSVCTSDIHFKAIWLGSPSFNLYLEEKTSPFFSAMWLLS